MFYYYNYYYKIPIVRHSNSLQQRARRSHKHTRKQADDTYWHTHIQTEIRGQTQTNKQTYIYFSYIYMMIFRWSQQTGAESVFVSKLDRRGKGARHSFIFWGRVTSVGYYLNREQFVCRRKEIEPSAAHTHTHIPRRTGEEGDVENGLWPFWIIIAIILWWLVI